MKTNTILLFILLACSSIMHGQVEKDSLSYNLNSNFSGEETWQIHKAAYFKQLKSKGLPAKEIEAKMAKFEKIKEEFIAGLREHQKSIELQRKKASEQRALAEIQRKKASELRKTANIERVKASEQRKIAATQRIKANEQRKIAAIQRVQARKQREKVRELRAKNKIILSQNIELSQDSNRIKTIYFDVTEKTTLDIEFGMHLDSGKTLVELFNPKGTKEGELSLNYKSKSDKNKEKDSSMPTAGAFNKIILNAEAGKWKINIKPKNSEGNLSISIFNIYKTKYE